MKARGLDLSAMERDQLRSVFHQMNFRFNKIQEIPLQAEELLDSNQGHCRMELIRTYKIKGGMLQKNVSSKEIITFGQFMQICFM